MMGGVPAYLERLDPDISIMDNIQQQFLTPNTLMREEPRLLLQDFISDAHNYVSILKAIAQGEQTQLEISNHTGLSQGHISKYLSVLRDTGFVERRVPVTETEKSRRGHYNITDPYLRFYYRFMTTHSHVAMGRSQQTLNEIAQDMPVFIERYTWRELCQQWLLEASSHGALGFSLDKAGATWTTKYYVDVMGINQRARRLVLGACHWTAAPAEAKALHALIKQADNVTPKRGEWTVDFVGFSAKGWSSEAQALAAAVTTGNEAGKNWRAGSCRLLNLENVYADLKEWFPLADA